MTSAEPYFKNDTGDVVIYHGSALALPLEDETVQTCVTSPPYWGLRDYGVEGQIGLETTPDAYVVSIVEVFREVRRVLCDDGTLWLNLGDSYQNAKGQAGGVDPKQPARRHGLRPTDVSIPGLKPKDLVGIPWRVALALQADGWYLRSEIIWDKPNCMPDSTMDRPTRSHEHMFLLAKSRQYYYDANAIREPSVDPEASARRYESAFSGCPEGSVIVPGDPLGQRTRPEGIRIFNGYRNRRTVWVVPTQPYDGAHFATYPPALIEPCILAGSRPGDIVLDPFNGSGTTGAVSQKWGRRYVGVELNKDYIDLSAKRFTQGQLFAAGGAS